MKFTLRTVYALHVLTYLAARDQGCPDRVSTEEIAEAFDASSNHLAKVTARLADLDYIRTVRGRRGGLELASDPSSVTIGEIVDEFEPGMALADCMSDEPECTLAEVCRLQGMLSQGKKALLETLHQFTLADVIENRDAIRNALNPRPEG